MRASQWKRFLLASSVEGGLGVLAWGLGLLFHYPVGRTWRWDAPACAWGLAGVLPPAILFYWTVNARSGPLREIREFLEAFARPYFGDWALWQLAVLSILAGVGEETLFRDLIQGGLGQVIGTVWALGIASFVFGLVHCVTKSYAVITFGMGLYLGMLWLATGNLWTPIITHSAYDFAALAFFLRCQNRAGCLPPGV